MRSGGTFDWFCKFIFVSNFKLLKTKSRQIKKSVGFFQKQNNKFKPIFYSLKP